LIRNRYTLFSSVLLLIFAFINCSSDNQAIDINTFADNSTQIDDGGSFFPNIGGSTDVCTLDEEDNCEDESNPTGLVLLSTNNVDFNISEPDDEECLVIGTSGLTFEAEIDKDNCDQVDGNYQFSLLNGSGQYTQDRVTGNGEVTVCYHRYEIGQYNCQIKLVLNAEGAGSTYAYIIPISGETLDPLFIITSPTPGQIIDSRPGRYDDIDPVEGEYLITARGSVNMDLVSILEDTEILINADGVKYKTDFDENGNFSKQIGFSISQGIYDVTFSADKTNNTTISKSVTVVVADMPKFEIEVRDAGGNLIDVANPTDVANLIVGFKIPNFETAASDPDEMPVTISNIKFNGDDLADDIEIWFDGETSWCTDDDDNDYLGFDGIKTYCEPLASISELQSGVNTVSATASNVLGSIDDQVEIILDKDKPSISIHAPKQSELKPPNPETITIKGIIKNYAPYQVNYEGDTTLSPPVPEENDVGSYCQPQSDNDPTCPESNIKLWFNISTSDLNTPIYIYPEVSAEFITDTARESNDAIAGEASTSGNCSSTSNTETRFDGDETNTIVDEDGNIVTTVTDTEGNVTTYTTDTDGNVTISSDADGDENFVLIEDDEHVSNDVDIDANSGDISSTTDDASTDKVTTTSTDATTGEITQTTTQRFCNIPEGNFTLTLTVPSENHHAKVNLYTNILQFLAKSISGHRTIHVTTFHTGLTKEHNFRYHTNEDSDDPATTTLNAGTFGKPKTNCGSNDFDCVIRSPLSFSLSEGTIDRNTVEGEKIIKVLENWLNEEAPFEKIANGWLFWPRDADDKIDVEADFQNQYKAATGRYYGDFHTDLNRSWKEKFIQQGLHSPVMALKYWALARYVDHLQETGDKACQNRPDLCFFERGDKDSDPEKEYNVARDKCGAVITTAFVPLKDIRRVAKHWDVDVNEIQFLSVWNDVAGSDIRFDDIETGIWVVHNINLNDGGKFDIDMCLLPDPSDNPKLQEEYAKNHCDADVSSAETPAAFWRFIAYNMVYGGLLGPIAEIGNTSIQVDDETMPLMWSVGKLRLKLTDVLQFKVEQVGRTWTNKIIINKSNIDIINSKDILDLHDPEIMASKSIQIEPFNKCKNYYREKFPGYELPFGCNNDDDKNYPFVLEMNSTQGQYIYQQLMVGGQSTYLLGQVWQGVIQTFKKQIGCLHEELINPAINPQLFEYPTWISDGNQIDSNFEWEDFNFAIDLKKSDLKIYDGGITARLILDAGVNGVPLYKVDDRNSNPNAPPGNQNAVEMAHEKGHLVRSHDNIDPEAYPITSETPFDSVFAGISIDLEQTLNAASYLLFKKGPLILLDYFDIDEVTPSDNWTIPLDKVTLAESDICDIGGLMATDFEILFSNSNSLFKTATRHLDIIFDSLHPFTFSFNPIEGVENATNLQVGFSKIEISVKDLFPYTEDDSDQIFYENPKDQPEVLRVRVDGNLSLKAIYHKEQRQFNVFLDGYEFQNLHLSVPKGHGGGLYDDANIVEDLISSAIIKVFNDSKSEFSTEADALSTMVIKLSGSDDDSGNISVVNLNDIDFTFNTELAENQSCNGVIPLYKEDTNQNAMPLITRFPKKSLNKKNINANTHINSPNIQNLESDFYRSSHDFSPFRTCDFPAINGEDENPFLDALCKWGIKDITLDPTIYIDNETGYLHVSADLAFELYNWLEED